MDYREAIAYIESCAAAPRTLPPGVAAQELNLPRMAALLAALGYPQRAFPAIVVAGTKGKGSTCAFLESVLRTAGLRVGLWTSPHLHSYRERIQVNRELIAPDALVAQVDALRPVVAGFDTARFGGPPIPFELGFAIALRSFAQRQVDIAVLEVGIGGRYDSVNVVTPLVSVITSISYDHRTILGDTLGQIAYDKAGIIKPGVPVVTAPQREEAATVIERVAAEVGVPLYVSGREVRGERQEVRGKGQFEVYFPSVICNLRGPFQQENAALAATTAYLLRQQGFAIGDEAIRAGLSAAQWPGRLEVVGERPTLVIDGAHNGDSAERLAEALRAEFVFRRLVLVLGVLGDKEVAAIAEGIVPHAAEVIVTAPRTARALGPDALAAAVQPALCGQLHRAPTVAEALALARSRAGSDDLICVTGSLSTVAEARVAAGLASIGDD